MDRLRTTTEQLSVMQEMYDAALFEVTQSPTVKTEADYKREQVAVAREKLNVFVNTEILEREFTQFMLFNGIEIESFSFSPATGAVSAIKLNDIPVLRAETGGDLPPDELVSLVFNIAARSEDVTNIMLLSEYVNGIYSYRLMNMNISRGRDGGSNIANYTIEALLRTD
jgi:hypothetical protein